ncbi:MAG TPA: class I SAM-dependent methyltransferase [Spirochaetota bacterium]|nr:class I SAM-dependent methyltransferase [Spirochaetota bacterium]
MNSEIGKKYDKISEWWHNNHNESNYGLPQIEKAVRYTKNHGSALDVGCGSGGRIIRKLLSEGFYITAIDVSSEMIKIAQSNHSDVNFIICDISDWDTDETFDLIIAWDSIFHLPMKKQRVVISRLCAMLKKDGIIIYTFGDAYGEHESEWHGDNFFYGSIGIDQNLKTIMESGCQCRHLELDQYPEKHVYIIAQKKI